MAKKSNNPLLPEQPSSNMLDAKKAVLDKAVSDMVKRSAKVPLCVWVKPIR